MLRRFHDLVAQGVKTDKGFNEVHVRQVAAMLSEFTGAAVSVSKIHNYMRKWRQRWVKVCRLRDLSGALWDDSLHMIVLDEEHLLGHTKARH
jgi:methionine salvage enolase-phosphatase E1